jgi:two-component system chemotaxis response regulator CheB
MLAERLNQLSALEVREASAGDAVSPGRVLLAPGNFHLRVTGSMAAPRIALDQSPPVNSCRPAVDVLFESLAALYGGAVLAAVLTGMGSDGTAGASMLKKRGARIIAQDEASSVVWGMPGAVVNAGLADAIVSLEELPATLGDLARSRGVVPASRREELCGV